MQSDMTKPLGDGLAPLPRTATAELKDRTHTTPDPATSGRPADSVRMSAVVQDRYGAAELLRHENIPRPEPADDEVLVRVHAAGLDRGTWHLMTGKPYLMRIAGLGFRGPKDRVPGRDLAGTVAALGASVTGFAVGDEIYGVGRGAFAEYAVARADKLARKPIILSFEQAAVVPISAATALQALTDHGGLQPGQQVLVIGASGGVGSYAVQLAKSLGAEVTGVASTAKLDLVRSMGADHVIDYTRDDFADTGHRYDLILDIGGNPALRRLRRALTPTGTAVIVGGENGGNLTGGMNRTLRALALSSFISQRFTNFINKERGGDLDRLTALIDAGQVTPCIDRTYPLEQVPEAMRRLAAGQVRGKVAITV